MKKLIVLTAVLMLTASLTGCRCSRWWRRGAACNPCEAQVTCGTEYITSSPCDTGACGAIVNDPVLPGPGG